MGVNPLDFNRQHPRGRAGKFASKTRSAPASVLTVSDAKSAQLANEYNELWQRVNANHRGSIYADADRLSRTSSDPAELAVLSHLAFGDAAMNVAGNPHTPAAVLHRMTVGASDHERDCVRRAAIMHDNCDPVTIQRVWDNRATRHPERCAADLVANAPNTPDELRAEATGWQVPPLAPSLPSIDKAA